MLREVMTESGLVRGIPAADPRVTAFKGIPFAAPPTGKNRWRAPQPAEKWEGVRSCFEFGPSPCRRSPAAIRTIFTPASGTSIPMCP
ncbi:MAG: carboxylesterase family protein [Oscillospiraceae bacterium]|nr:carboxylesterase family protein [Oscillospiraceae bacterium]